MEEQNESLAFRAKLPRFRRGVEREGVDRLVQPSVAVDTVTDDGQRAVCEGHQREVTSDCRMPISDGSEECRGRRVRECRRVIYNVQERAVVLLRMK